MLHLSSWPEIHTNRCLLPLNLSVMNVVIVGHTDHRRSPELEQWKRTATSMSVLDISPLLVSLMMKEELARSPGRFREDPRSYFLRAAVIDTLLLFTVAPTGLFTSARGKGIQGSLFKPGQLSFQNHSSKGG